MGFGVRSLTRLSFGALAILGNARAERDHHSVLEVLDREASFFSFFSPHVWEDRTCPALLLTAACGPD
jgi:hypothetical protein